MNLNKVFILGNLTRDPERRNLPSGQPVTSFGIATNRFFNDKQGQKQQEVEFHNVTTFGRLAEISSQYLQKGSLVLIEGRLRTSSWQDSSGNKHFKTEIIANNLQLGPRRATQEQTQTNSNKDIPVSDKDIPVIEEEPKDNPSQNKDEEEIDISKIPF